MDFNELEPMENEQIGKEPIEFNTGKGIIRYFGEDGSVFTLIPTQEDNGVINMSGISDYILEQSSDIKEEEFKNKFEEIINTLGLKEEYIPLDNVKEILMKLSEEFKKAKESGNSDLYIYELDLDSISTQILSILLLRKQKQQENNQQ